MSHRYPALVTSVVAATALSMGLAACSSSNSSSSGSTSNSGGTTNSGAGKNLELVVGTKSDDFYVTMECGAEAEAKALGMNLTVNGPADFSVSEQAPILNAAAASKPDALLVAPTDAKALDPELQRIQSAGTKIIFVDTSSSNSSLGVSRITSDNIGGGKLAADNLAKQIPGITVLPTQYDNDSTATAASQVASDITAHPNLSGVFATNVLSAQGAGTGVQHAGKSGKVKVATFDADPQQMQMLQANSIQLAVAQDPYLEGQDGVQQALNAVEGKPVTANIGTPLVAINQQNMNQASIQKYIYKSSC
jgi:ribose transport system substrate-binding protein